MTVGPAGRDGALTGLRAVAAVLVIGTHTGFATGMLSHGYVGNLFARLEIGVPIFFALSGFLLFRPWVRAAVADTAAPSTRTYARKRVRRIMPAYVVAVLVTFGIYAFFDAGPNPGQSWEGLFRYLTLTHIYTDNLLLTYLHIGLPQMWSLAVEVSFYALLPLAAWLLLRGRRGPRRPTAVLALLAALALIEPLWLVLLNTTDLLPRAAGMWLPGHLTPFLGGMALTLLQAIGVRARAALLLPIAVAAYLVVASPLATGAFLGPVHWWQPVIAAGLYGLAATCVLAPLALGDRGWWYRLLNLRPVVFLGEISYEIFLLHVAVMALTMDLLLGWPIFTGSPAILWPLTLAITIPFAWGLHLLTAPRATRVADQDSLRRAGTSISKARPRCERESFSSGDNSAADRSSPSGTNTGS